MTIGRSPSLFTQPRTSFTLLWVGDPSPTPDVVKFPAISVTARRNMWGVVVVSTVVSATPQQVVVFPSDSGGIGGPGDGGGDGGCPRFGCPNQQVGVDGRFPLMEDIHMRM